MATRYARVLLITLLSAVAGGCLSKEEAISGTPGGGDNVAQSGNSAPTISGWPDTAVMTGDTYSFTPSASDANGDALTFSVDNLPRWARFDASTGRLSGQPVLGDEGTYARITISVSDGSTSVSLPTFSIEVTQTALGSMTLSWMPPTLNEDGSPLTDLAGYHLYFGTLRGTYTRRISIDNPGISTYVINNLLPDTYYVVARAFNASGVLSSYSNEAVITVTAF